MPTPKATKPTRRAWAGATAHSIRRVCGTLALLPTARAPSQAEVPREWGGAPG
jgi:hypothetical protein